MPLLPVSWVLLAHQEDILLSTLVVQLPRLLFTRLAGCWWQVWETHAPFWEGRTWRAGSKS